MPTHNATDVVIAIYN